MFFIFFHDQSSLIFTYSGNKIGKQKIIHANILFVWINNVFKNKGKMILGENIHPCIYFL